MRRKQEEEGKEEQRPSSQNPKLKRTKESENSGGQKAEGKQVKLWNGRPRKRREAKQKCGAEREKVSRKEAAAEIEAGGRRKEIADETATKHSGWKPERVETTA